MANSRYYSNTATQTTLSGSVTAGATSIQVGSVTGFPTSYPYTLAVDYGAATEELVSVTAAASTTLTVTRGYGGTSAQSHSLGAVVRHVWDAQDATDFRTHEGSTGAVHGLTGSIVGTSDTQTLSNKTLTSPTVNAGALSGTFTGAHTYSGAVTMSGGGTLTGTFTGAPTFSGTPTFSGNTTFSGSTTAMTVTGEVAHSNLFRGTRAAFTDSQWETRQTGDSAARHFMQADGKHWWGSGAATVDTNLYRSAADTLRTDDSLIVSTNLTVSGTASIAGDLTVDTTTWTAFTPTWTIGGSPPTTTNVGWYKKLGKIVLFEIYTVWGNLGSGSSTVQGNLPSTPFRDGNGANTTRQFITGWISGLNTITGGLCFGQILASGTGTAFALNRYDDLDIEAGEIQNNTIATIQGWYREA